MSKDGWTMQTVVFLGNTQDQMPLHSLGLFAPVQWIKVSNRYLCPAATTSSNAKLLMEEEWKAIASLDIK